MAEEPATPPLHGNDAKRRAVLIAGPTASGKSALALSLARSHNGVIINADAMQVYRDLSVLTARPGRDDMASVSHHLYGHVDALEPYSVARWLEEATTAIAAAWQEGRTPIVAGGTGLYFRALEHGLAVIPPLPAVIRERWRNMLAEKGSEALHVELARRDALAAATIRTSDAQRILRALEVHDATGRSLLDWQAETTPQPLLEGAQIDRLVLAPERPVLHRRINDRFQHMVSSGAMDEVKALIARRLPADAMVSKAIGVSELGEVIAGNLALNEAVTLAQARTRQYAKRQMTWFRNQMEDWTVINPDNQQIAGVIPLYPSL